MVARFALIAVAGVVLGGCYASTDPASDVGPVSAKLNARGTANSGPATSHFEYWINGTANRVRWTDDRHWPAGSSGPFFEKVAGLAASTAYSFRVCGSNDGDHAGGCAQTRSFTTTPAVEDSATGDWNEGPSFYGSVDARSGPSGQNPQGRIFARFQFKAFDGSVTCLLVDGHRAIVGAVGNVPGNPAAKETMLTWIVDGGPSGTDAVFPSISEGATTPPDCASGSGSFGGEIEIAFFRYGGDLVVNDAP